MKYNLGCGSDYRHGWVNVDQFAASQPDVVMDLETFPWPLDDDSADEILLSHVLEHLGGSADVFLKVMQELYRICKPSALITIRVPDPRHDDYLSDPTHQRPVIPGLFQPFDLALIEGWQAAGLPGTPLGKYLGIDFATRQVTHHLDPRWLTAFQEGRITREALGDAMSFNNNVIQWHEIVLEAVKPFSPGRSLKALDSLVAKRTGGMGDVLMALSALSALKRATGVAVYLETSEAYIDLKACADIDGVFTSPEQVEAHMASRAPGLVKYIDWSPAAHGCQRRHQVDAFLMSLGVTLADSHKGLTWPEVDGPPSEALFGLPPRTGSGRRIVIHAGATDPNRTWPVALWQTLVEDLLKSGHQVILVGKRDSEDGRSALAVKVEGVQDLTDRLSLQQTLHLLKACDLLVSSDSGPIQLAGATDIAIVGLYSVAGGAARLPFRSGSTAHRAIGITPACPFHPCYPAINDPEALSAFIAREGIAANDGPAIFSRWCLNPDRYACLRENETLGAVKAAIGTLLNDTSGTPPPYVARPRKRPPSS